jgi:hypothetical protein
MKNHHVPCEPDHCSPPYWTPTNRMPSPATTRDRAALPPPALSADWTPTPPPPSAWTPSNRAPSFLFTSPCSLLKGDCRHRHPDPLRHSLHPPTRPRATLPNLSSTVGHRRTVATIGLVATATAIAAPSVSPSTRPSPPLIR